MIPDSWLKTRRLWTPISWSTRSEESHLVYLEASLEWKLADFWLGLFFLKAPSDVGRWEAWLCLLPCLPIHITWRWR